MFHSQFKQWRPSNASLHCLRWWQCTLFSPFQWNTYDEICIRLYLQCHVLWGIRFNAKESHVFWNNPWHLSYQISIGRTSQIARFMRPTWGPHGTDRTQVDPMLAPWTLLSGSMANCLNTVHSLETFSMIQPLSDVARGPSQYKNVILIV